MHSTLLVRAFGSCVKDAAYRALRAASDDRYANLGDDENETEDSMFGWLRGTRDPREFVKEIGRFYRRGDTPESEITTGTPWDHLLLMHGGPEGLVKDTWDHVECRVIVAPSDRRKDCIAFCEREDTDMLLPDDEFWHMHNDTKADMEDAALPIHNRSWAFVFDVKDIA